VLGGTKKVSSQSFDW